ncbi:hypothetical protein M0804_014873 [Polistes exclamans]|nr:hypothetical protein M0804_014873 [Polistes exclamans]
MAHDNPTMGLNKQKSEFFVTQLIHLNDIFDKIDDKLMELESKEELEKLKYFTRSDNIIEKDNQFIKATVNITNYQNESTDSIHKRAKIIENLKKYLNLINYFNGSNIYVEEFITDIKIVLDKLPIEERELFFMLVHKQKIIGEAKSLLDGIQIKNVKELFEALRVLFGDTTEIVNARMKRNECIQGNDSLSMYNLKFLQTQVDIIKAVVNNPALPASKKKFRLLDEKRSALNAYISGLKYDIKILLLLKAFKPKTLSDAINMALNIERNQKLFVS